MTRAGGLIAVTVLVVVGIHTLIPHKEGRYLLPVLPVLAVLLIPRLQEKTYRAGVGAVALCVAWSLVGPWVAERVGPPIADWTDRAVFLTPNPEPQASDVVLQHPALEGDLVQVGFIAGPEQEPLRLTVVWELYARNDHPVIGLSPVPGPAALEQGPGLVMDLLTTRAHDGAMRSKGFELAAESTLEPVIRLWTRGAPSRTHSTD